MKHQRRNPIRISTTLGAIVLSSALLGSCGGGTSAVLNAGIGGTGIVFGAITGFGSVWVNGNRYNIDASELIVDDDSGAGIDQDDLKLGMLIRLDFGTENGTLSGGAIRVVYDDEVEGPFAAVPTPDPMDSTIKIGQIFGQTIKFSDTTTIFEFTNFENLGNEGNANADVVEISGYRVSDTEIRATYVRYKGDLVPDFTKAELRGEISGYAGGNTFVVDGMTINLIGTTTFDPPELIIDNGLYVEVKGTIKSGLVSIDADRVEAEDREFADDVDDISLQGVVTGFTDIDADFFVAGQRVNASGAELSPSNLVLMDGLVVEVEGEIVGGTLIADGVEAHDGDSKLRSFVGTVNLAESRFTVTYPTTPGVVTVHVDGNTVFEDDSDAVVTQPFSLDDLNSGNVDFVRVEGVEILNDEVLATFVRRRAPSEDDPHRLEGQVDNFKLGSFITVLGIDYGLDAATVYEPSPPDIVPGKFVEIEDFRMGELNPAGIADIVEED